MNLWAVFLTGLTTGGLTCLAIQGGLLATALTRQQQAAAEKRHGKKRPPAAPGVQLADNLLPVGAFLVAKLLAHTLLGFLLGALGSVAQIAPPVQGTIQIIAGLFMLVTALNMLDVHPFFRRFTLQPPKAITRLVRDQAKSQQVFAPMLLGLMTVFIPCGTTQAMELLAVSSADPLTGAAVMFVFVLGTSPLFLALGVLATRARGQYEPLLRRAAAALVLVLGFIAVDTGLNVLGAPFAPTRLIAQWNLDVIHTPPVAATIQDGVQVVTINATNYGYLPNTFVAQAGIPIRLKLITVESYGCERSFTIPMLGIHQVLPATGETVIDLPAQPGGSLLFSCSMGMYTGVIRIG